MRPSLYCNSEQNRIARRASRLAVPLVVVAALIAPAHGELLVYEPFDYTPDEILTGKGGARGTTGTWTTFDFITGDGKTQDWFVHAEGMTSGVGLSNANPSAEPGGLHWWDGTVDNLLTSGGYVGLWGADDWNDPDPHNGEPGRNLDANIGLDPSVTASFQPGTTTWFSYVAVRGWDRNEETPSLIIGSDPTPNNSRGASLMNGGSGFGTGGGPPRGVRTQIYPMYFDSGNPFTANGQVMNFQDDAKAPPADGRMSWQELDSDNFFGAVNIVVGKIEWDADTGGEDIISVARFLETETISEAAFDALIAAQPNLSSANWADNKPDLDQSTFDTLSIAGLKFFVDEVRIATTFDEALSGGVAPAVPPQLHITESGADLSIEWDSRPGMFYVLRSSTDLAADLATWNSVNVPGSVENNGVFEIAHTAPRNTAVFMRPGDQVRFYRVEEFALPPVTLLDENFDGVAAGTLPAGWTTGFDVSDTLENTKWELGDPAPGPPSGPPLSPSGPHCVGTNIVGDFGTESNTWLRTPPINLTNVTAATLRFQQWIDIDNFDGIDGGSVRILDSTTFAELELVEENINGLVAGWNAHTAFLSEASLGNSVVVEFRFVSDADGTFDFAGWYIDDVLLTTPAP